MPLTRRTFFATLFGGLLSAVGLRRATARPRYEAGSVPKAPGITVAVRQDAEAIVAEIRKRMDELTGKLEMDLRKAVATAAFDAARRWNGPMIDTRVTFREHAAPNGRGEVAIIVPEAGDLIAAARTLGEWKRQDIARAAACPAPGKTLRYVQYWPLLVVPFVPCGKTDEVILLNECGAATWLSDEDLLLNVRERELGWCAAYRDVADGEVLVRRMPGGSTAVRFVEPEQPG